MQARLKKGEETMITNEYKIQVEGSLPYAKLRTYLWEKSPEIKREKRPMILIRPGGGYDFPGHHPVFPAINTK